METFINMVIFIVAGWGLLFFYEWGVGRLGWKKYSLPFTIPAAVISSGMLILLVGDLLSPYPAGEYGAGATKYIVKKVDGKFLATSQIAVQERDKERRGRDGFGKPLPARNVTVDWEVSQGKDSITLSKTAGSEMITFTQIDGSVFRFKGSDGFEYRRK
jgi:hypothetical protein